MSSRSIHRRLLRLVSTHWPALILAVGLGTTASLLAIGQAKILSAIVNRAFLAGSSAQALAPQFILFLGLLLARGLLTFGAETAASALSTAV